MREDRSNRFRRNEILALAAGLGAAAFIAEPRGSGAFFWTGRIDRLQNAGGWQSHVLRRESCRSFRLVVKPRKVRSSRRSGWRAVLFWSVPKRSSPHPSSLRCRRTMSFRPVPKHRAGRRRVRAVGEPCRLDRFRNHWTRFRPMAWRFILEPPEKKQASRFNDLAHRCVLQVSTRVNSRARRGTEPYSTTPRRRRAVVLRGRTVPHSAIPLLGPAKAGFSFRPKASRGFQWPARCGIWGSLRAWAIENRARLLTRLAGGSSHGKPARRARLALALLEDPGSRPRPSASSPRLRRFA